MRRKIGAVLALVICLAAGCSGQVGLSRPEQQLFDLVNQERQRAGLPKFQWDYHLAEAARAHTQLQAQKADLSHRFDGEPALDERLAATGARFNEAAENVAGAPAVAAMHKSLMESPPHRANILNPEYNALGLAIVERDGELYATQDFARLIPTYTEQQFQDALIRAFNQTRKGYGVPPIDARSDPRMKAAACAKNLDADKLIKNFPGVTDIVLFTASEPQKLPGRMETAAADATLRRMNIGVCYVPQSKLGFFKFWVVAAFYPVD